MASYVNKVTLYSDFRVPARSISAKINNPHVSDSTAKAAYEIAGISPEEVDDTKSTASTEALNIGRKLKARHCLSRLVRNNIQPKSVT